MAVLFLFFFATIPFLQQTDQPHCNCCTETYQQFDFWVGSWEVFNPEGKKVGENEIVPVQGHCALQENWKGASGGSGTSLNYYNSQTEKWHQVWVDQSGGVLNLSGSFADHKMVLKSETLFSEKQQKHYQERITWINNNDGTVRQLWERTTDEGASWKVVFDGLYKRKGE